MQLHAVSQVVSQVQAATVTTQSTDRGQQLAKRLKDAGARMYGAFWCSHCHEQKEAFGSQAMQDFPYVECYPNGFHKVCNVQLCLLQHVLLPGSVQLWLVQMAWPAARTGPLHGIESEG